MSTMTFIGRTTREAMSLAKARFGADVQIVDSRQTDDGVELTMELRLGQRPGDPSEGGPLERFAPPDRDGAAWLLAHG